MSASGQRVIAKAKRPTIPLTGAENITLVDENRIFNHGYKYFLAPNKILEIFGERVARSKKIRKAKIRDILKNAMRSIEKNNQMTVNDFMNLTEQIIKQHVTEIQGMQSSPQEMIVEAGPSGFAASAASAAASKRKKQSSPVNISPDATPVVEQKAQKVDPIANQMDFITDLMNRTTQASILQRTGSLPGTKGREVYLSKDTERSIRARLAEAQKKDEANMARQRMIDEEARRTEATRYMRSGMKDITDMFGKSGL